jgi:hypothetical protein
LLPWHSWWHSFTPQREINNHCPFCSGATSWSHLGPNLFGCYSYSGRCWVASLHSDYHHQVWPPWGFLATRLGMCL